MVFLRVATCTLLTILVQNIQAENKCDLKQIFRTPEDFAKCNYDHFEILERSNFEKQPTVTPEITPGEAATDSSGKSFANAQISLRFGGRPVEDRHPYHHPYHQYCLPPCPYWHPYPWYLPPFPTPPHHPQFNPCNINEIEKEKMITHFRNRDHPQVLNTVDLTNEPVASSTTDVLEYPGSNLQTVQVDLNKVPERQDVRTLLDNAVVPYYSPKCPECRKKLLVTYPITGEEPKRPTCRFPVDVDDLTRYQGQVIVPETYQQVVPALEPPKIPLPYPTADLIALVPPPKPVECFKVVPKYDVVPKYGYVQHTPSYCSQCAKYTGELNEGNLAPQLF